jgi:PKHD-type hydroxylase
MRVPEFQHPGQVVTTSFESNWYWFAREMLSPAKVLRVRELCEGAEEEEALTGGSSKPNPRIRKNKVSWHDSPELYSMLGPMVRNINTAAGWNYEITAIEPAQFTTYYGDESHYDWHTDTLVADQALSPGASGPLAGTVRKLSLSVQLSASNEYDGGEFQFLVSGAQASGQGEFVSSNVDLVSRASGAGVAFPSFTYHRVTPVTRGVRKSLVCWFRGPKWV